VSFSERFERSVFSKSLRSSHPLSDDLRHLVDWRRGATLRCLGSYGGMLVHYICFSGEGSIDAALSHIRRSEHSDPSTLKADAGS